MNQFSAYINELLDKKGISLNQLARELGVNPSHLAGIRNGKRRAGGNTFSKFFDYTRITTATFRKMQDASVDDPPVPKEYDIELREDQIIAIEWWNSLTPEERGRIRQLYSRKNKPKSSDE